MRTPPPPPAWTARRHGPLVPLADDLWTVEAELELLPIGRRMTIARLGNGDLVVQSAIACGDAVMSEIAALGRVGYIIVPSPYHRIDAPAWKARFPDARVLTTPTAAARVGRVVPVDGNHALLPADPRLGAELLDGVPTEAVLIQRDAAGAATLIFNDVFMNLPDRLPGWRGVVTKVIGSTGGPKVTRTSRWFIVADRRALAAHLRRLAATPGLARLVPGHGAVVERDAPAVLAGVAATLASARRAPANP